jgi:hypothetical protein
MTKDMLQLACIRNDEEEELASLNNDNTCEIATLFYTVTSCSKPELGRLQ